MRATGLLTGLLDAGVSYAYCDRAQRFGDVASWAALERLDQITPAGG